MLNEEQLFALAYNAHESAENAALEAMRAELGRHSVEALACLADPEWRWETRSWISGAIIDQADGIVNEKFDAMVAS